MSDSQAALTFITAVFGIISLAGACIRTMKCFDDGAKEGSQVEAGNAGSRARSVLRMRPER
jgi:hypothetical protein